MKLWTTV